MKEVGLFFWITVVYLFTMSSQSFSHDYVCIDPGHGGPGASQFGLNGDGHGECGSQADMSLERG
jgi:hypothetical protein